MLRSRTWRHFSRWQRLRWVVWYALPPFLFSLYFGWTQDPLTLALRAVGAMLIGYVIARVLNWVFERW